jgi:hypothetical protein
LKCIDILITTTTICIRLVATEEGVTAEVTATDTTVTTDTTDTVVEDLALGTVSAIEMDDTVDMDMGGTGKMQCNARQNNARQKTGAFTSIAICFSAQQHFF